MVLLWKITSFYLSINIFFAFTTHCVSYIEKRMFDVDENNVQFNFFHTNTFQYENFSKQRQRRKQKAFTDGLMIFMEINMEDLQVFLKVHREERQILRNSQIKAGFVALFFLSNIYRKYFHFLIISSYYL